MADRIVDPGTGISIREMGGRSGSETGSRDTAERSFLCKGSDDPNVCRQALINQKVPLELETFDGLALQELAWNLYAAEENWKFDAAYSWEPSPGEFTVTMDSTGGSIKVTEAIAQMRSDAPGEIGTDHGTSINVDKEGNPQGVDRVIPALKLNIMAKLSTGIAADPIAYAKLVANVTGYTNQTPYLQFAAGELLFLGATGEIIGENPTLNYAFAASPNLTNIPVGAITVSSKKGHDYIWVSYRTKKDPGSKRNSEHAVAAYVSEIYGEAEMNVLGIGA